MRTITVLGNNSGHNAGDVAILGNLVQDFHAIRQDVRFLVPTASPRFIKKTFGDYNVKPVSMLPWNGAIKNFGLPMFTSMLKTDVVLITDNILYDHKYYNPIINYLSSIALYAPTCKRRYIPVVLYNASIGPINLDVGARAIRKVMECCTLIITRDESTRRLLKELGVSHPQVIVNADCALNTTSSDKKRIDEIAAKEGLFTNPNGTIGFNLNANIDKWNKGGTFTLRYYLKTIAWTIDYLIEKLDIDVVFVISQNADQNVTRDCFHYIRNSNRVRIISNQDYNYEELTGILQRVEVLVGLRTHALIFSAVANTPMIGLESHHRSNGFMETIDQNEWVINISNLTSQRLSDTILEAWEQRAEIREELTPIVEMEKIKARKSAGVIDAILDGKEMIDYL